MSDFTGYLVYDGDGKADLAVFRSFEGTRHMLNSSGETKSYSWEDSSDIPVPGDYSMSFHF
ncbi:MAG TPA: hypothetical protein VNM22_16180 [Candidatus Limnocylindrales bacterium]|nr:hypothetical protein [Candidatus Limnocylindrales bacterium]